MDEEKITGEEKEVYGEIYVIENDVNDKLYVGQTTKSLKKRFKQHCRADSLIGRAIRKYGAEHFTIRSLEKCYSRKHQNEREVYWIATLNSKAPHGYNLTDGSEGTINPAEETREKMSMAKKGHPGHPQPESAKIDIAAAQIGNKNGVGNKSNTGQKLPAEQCAKMSASRKAYYSEHPEAVEQMSARGKAYYEEHPEMAEQISVKLKVYLSSHPEALQQRIEHLRNYNATHPEAAQELAERMRGNTYALGYKHTPEARAKISAANKARWERKRAEAAAQENNQRDE